MSALQGPRLMLAANPGRARELVAYRVEVP